MTKRVIAALVLSSLMGWAMPSAFALGIRGPKLDRHPSKAVEDHACCPKFHAQFLLPAVVPQSTPAMPCEDQPCCVKRAPENSPALPATNRTDLGERLAPRGTPLQVPQSGNTAAVPPSADFSTSYSALSTVLRI